MLELLEGLTRIMGSMKKTLTATSAELLRTQMSLGKVMQTVIVIFVCHGDRSVESGRG